MQISFRIENIQIKFQEKISMISLIAFIVLALVLIKIHLRGTQYNAPRRNLSGKVAVITGGNSGIGKQTAMDLARNGCFIIIGARDQEKSEKVKQEIINKTGSRKIEHYPLDLASKDSIQNFCSHIAFEKIDYLINNAAVMDLPKRTLSKDGHEMQYATNFLGHFYLTYLLYQKLCRSQFFKIINLSSKAHIYLYAFLNKISLDFDNMSFDKIKYFKPLAYSRSKLMMAMFARALAQKIPSNKGCAYSLHPGVVRTNILRYSPILQAIKIVCYPIFYLMSKSAREGAQTTLYLVYEDSRKLPRGQYYADCKMAQSSKEIKKENWDKLWKVSEQDLGIEFVI